MTKKLLVFLVSDQTVPNVQFLKWYLKSESKNSDTDLLLVSTEKMENNETSDKILNAAEYFHDSYKIPYVISVKQNDVNDVKIQLDNFFKQYSYDEVVANITGGTKLMSISVYQYIAGMKNSVIYYKPIDGDMVELFPEHKTLHYDIELNFDEYMAALGLECIESKNVEACFNNYEFNRNFYKECWKPNQYGLRFLSLLDAANKSGTFNLLEFTSSKKCSPADKNKAVTMVKYCGQDPKTLSIDSRKYITGGWLEELVYQHIKNKYNLEDSQIKYDVKVVKGDEVFNEYDIAYIYDNRLHVVECKAFLDSGKGAGANSEKILDALMKLKSLKDFMGLASELYLYTTSRITPSVQARADEFGIHVIYGNMLENL